MRHLKFSLAAAVLPLCLLVPALAAGPERVVSLMPSYTEIIFELGAGGRLAGVSNFCDWPPAAAAVERTGDYLRPSVEKIYSLKPDMVFSGPGAAGSPAKQLAALGVKVVEVPEERTVADIFSTIRLIAGELGLKADGEKLVNRLGARLSAAPPGKPIKVYIEADSGGWTAGGLSFLSDAVRRAGGENIFAAEKKGYFQASWEEVLLLDPQAVILLSGSREEFLSRPMAGGLAAVKSGRVITALDRNAFSRPGPRIFGEIKNLRPCCMERNKILLLLAALAAACVLSLAAGPAGLADADVILGLRLPRTLAALAVGAALGLAGALFQGVLKNPLSDPYILGTSSGATAAAVFCFISGIERTSPVFFLAVFAGAFGATFLSYWLARLAGRLSDAALVLAGVAVSAFLSALVMLTLSVARERSFSLLYFVMGGLYAVAPGVLAVSAAIIAAAGVLSMARWRALDAMALGEEKAYHLGADPGRERLVFFSLACAATSAAVALGGTIGFVGLMTPHIIRLVSGPSARYLVPASAIGGAALLAAADAAGRSLFSPAEIPAGVIMALAGAPFFMWLLWRRSGGRV